MATYGWPSNLKRRWPNTWAYASAPLAGPFLNRPSCETAPSARAKKTLLLRVGEAGPLTPRKIANHMANIWAKKYNRRPGNDAYGCLVGLAEVWPEGQQVAIFKAVLANWSDYMSGVRLEQNIAEDQGEAVKYLKWDYPVISVMRRYPTPAIEMYAMMLQAKQKALPASLKAAYFAIP